VGRRRFTLPPPVIEASRTAFTSLGTTHAGRRRPHPAVEGHRNRRCACGSWGRKAAALR